MKTLKLEVGKTYINRKGDKVRIVKKDDAPFGPYPYRREDGYSYQENGRFWHTEWTDDLIEEVPSETTRYTFAIPEGATKLTVEQVSNRIVVEMVPEAGPKPGDVMINEQGSVYIFKEVEGNHHRYKVHLGESGWLSIGAWCYPGRPATPEEAQPLWGALKKAGKRWNPETMQVEDVPEKAPAPGGVMVNEKGSVYVFRGKGDGVLHDNYCVLFNDGKLGIGCQNEIGRPATPEEAQPLWDALKKAGKRWNPETMQVEDVPEIDRIREWVERHLEDGHYNHEGISEVIGHYLKHKEG